MLQLDIEKGSAIDHAGQAYNVLRTIVPVVLILMFFFWQFVLEPRVAYYRNRGDYFNKTLVKAKFLILIGLVFIAVNSLGLPTDASLFFGLLFIAGGATYIIQAIRIRRWAGETKSGRTPQAD